MYRDQLGEFVCGYWGLTPHYYKQNFMAQQLLH